MIQSTAARADDAMPTGEPSVGAHLVTRRHGYLHHGIYVGDGNVIHYAGWSHHLSGGPVEIVTLDGFRAGFEFAVIRHARTPYDGMEAARRAASRLGECRYRLLTNNCEHFCLWCLFGVGRSEQVASCLRNPVHGMAVAVTLIACVLVARWHPAAAGARTPGSVVGLASAAMPSLRRSRPSSGPAGQRGTATGS